MSARLRGGSSAQNNNTDLQGYVLGKELGRGGFGVVYEGMHASGEYYAIKRMSLANMGPEDLSAFQAEVDLLKKLRHPNIVKYIDSVRTQDYLYVVLE